MSEFELQTQCNAYLRSQGLKFIHLEKGRKVGRTHRKGIPDLLIFLGSGKIALVELKSDRGKMSDEQVLWYTYCREQNYPYLCTSSFHMFKDFLYKLI